MSRRQLLRWSALAAATPLVADALDLPRAYAVTSSSQAVPMNLELVTLREDRVVLTWFTGDPSNPDANGRPQPVPADTEVLLGTSPASMATVYSDSTATPYHYAEVTGLEPGQTYFYLARSGGVPATPAAFFPGNPVGTSTLNLTTGGPYAFTTPQPPPGELLFAIALCNDIHIGETVSGLALSEGGVDFPPGFAQVPGEPPYPEVMAQALVADAPARGAHLVLAGGDLTSSGTPTQVGRAKSLLSGLGTYRQDWFAVRGNHDRWESGSAYAGCSPAPADVAGAGYEDCFKDGFFPGDQPTWFTTSYGGLRILGLDTFQASGNGGSNGQLGAEQLAWISSTLQEEPERPTLCFGHHPVTTEATATTDEPVIFDLAPQDALALEQAYAAAPGVFLHHSGHTHRNKTTRGLVATGVTFQEVAATKEYPGGFHLLRVFTGGYALNFYKTRSDLAREWSERTRQEYLGVYPFYTAGTISDRNLVVARDLSGLSVPADLPESPRAVALPLAAAAAVTAGAVGGAALRRARERAAQPAG